MSLGSLTWEAVAALYASVVATAALALELRRWFVSGVRLTLSASYPMIAIGIPEAKNRDYLILFVENRGDKSTTIKCMHLRNRRSIKHVLKKQKSWHAFVPHPSISPDEPGVPHLLSSGGKWEGVIEVNEELKRCIESGNLQVGIGATHANKPVFISVKPSTPQGESDRCERGGRRTG
ncbi:hypothetical protein [Roseospira goensis]|uniref:Uncharacterized protein n=1 Tax=Roseospira goensis TaxID=391922 RepID=A0A7W6RYV3_9PROT|nr:hypothetical protein [Roseospira goensis]MBB4285758.1 hypothetical protein [Roseospira goensis]